MSFAGFVELLRILVESHRDSFEGLVQRLAETYRAREDAATIQGRVGRVPMSCPVYEGQDANLLTPARHRALQRGLVRRAARLVARVLATYCGAQACFCEPCFLRSSPLRQSPWICPRCGPCTAAHARQAWPLHEQVLCLAVQ